jgi:hypothetical protein
VVGVAWQCVHDASGEVVLLSCSPLPSLGALLPSIPSPRVTMPASPARGGWPRYGLPWREHGYWYGGVPRRGLPGAVPIPCAARRACSGAPAITSAAPRPHPPPLVPDQCCCCRSAAVHQLLDEILVKISMVVRLPQSCAR